MSGELASERVNELPSGWISDADFGVGELGLPLGVVALFHTAHTVQSLTMWRYHVLYMYPPIWFVQVDKQRLSGRCFRFLVYCN